MKRVLFIVVLALTLIFSTMTLGLAADKIVFDFPSWQAAEPGFADWWNALIDEFESEHPNVEINFYQVPYKDYVSTLTTRFGAGDPPDILHMPAKVALGFIDLGWMQPLDSRLDGTDILSSWTPLQNGFEQDGKMYGVLLLGYGYSLYYNEKMFEEAGVSVPATLEELYEAAKKLTVDKDKDGVIDQYGFGMVTTTHPDVYTGSMTFVMGYGGAFARDGELTVNDPGVVKGLKMVDKLAEERLIPMGLSNEQKRSYFFEGKIAMIVDGPWVLALREGANPEVAKHIKVAIPPTNSGIIPGGMSNSIHIPQELSEEKEELVWQFIYKLTRPKWQVKYMELTKGPSPREGVLTEEILAKIPEMKTFIDCSQIAVTVLPSGYETQYTLFRRLVVDGIMKIITTDKPVESILNDLGKELNLELTH